MTITAIPIPESGLSFDDLYRRGGLQQLDQRFLDELSRKDAPLRERLERARAEPALLSPRQESELLLALAPHQIGRAHV